MNDLRVMQFIVGEPWGGAERFFVKLAGALHRRGLEQSIVIRRDETRATDLRESGIEPLQLDIGKGLRDLLARYALKREIKRFRPHVIMVWMNRAARRVPRGNYKVVGRLGGYYSLRFYKNCDWLIGNTPDLRDYLVRQGWPEERARMISNFGELEPLPPVSRATLDTPEDAFVALSLGRLHPSKGFDTLIESVARAEGVYLWLAGDGEQAGDLRNQARQLGIADRVRLLGWRDDQAALLAACDLCVVPSRHEPLSNVVLEAWSMARPVLATASEGPGWLINDHHNGRLVPVDDVSGLAEALGELRDSPDLCQELARAGHATWRARFSEAAICDEYLDFFSEIAGRN